jgi:hypothetical protein
MPKFTIMTPKRSSVVNHTKPNVKFLVQLRKRYAKAIKKQRRAILDEFVATTGYHRKHASALLSGKRQWRDANQPIHPIVNSTPRKIVKRSSGWLNCLTTSAQNGSGSR